MSKLEWKKIDFNGLICYSMEIVEASLVINKGLDGNYFLNGELSDIDEVKLNTDNLDEAKSRAFAIFQTFINEINETIDKHCEAVRMDKVVDIIRTK